MTGVGEAVALWRYPVSSAAGERVDRLSVSSGGIAGDRTWGVIDAATGAMADPGREKRWRTMPLIAARLREHGPQIAAGDLTWHALPSPEADAAASAVLGFAAAFRPHVSATPGEAVPPRYRLAPVHLLTSASLAWLAESIADPVQADTRRFRPNVVLETGGAPGFLERQWIGRRLRLGTAMLSVAEPCPRCSFVALAQHGLSFEPEILHKIAAHGEGGFGVYCAVEEPGEIRAGDMATLLD